MKSRTMAILCAALSLMLFAAPLSALAEDSATPIDTKIGPYSLSRVYVSLEGMHTDSLNLNGIPYRPSLDRQNRRIVYTGDLLAALDGAELLQNNNGLFQAGDLLISGGKLSLVKKPGTEAVDVTAQMEKGCRAVWHAFFTQDQVAKYGPEIAEALNALNQLIDTLEPQEARDELRKLFDIAEAKKYFNLFIDNPENAVPRFRIGMRGVYSFLFDARTALATLAATQDVSAALEKIENSALMQAMQTVLKETLNEADYKYTDFWSDDAFWAAYTKQYLLDKEFEAQGGLSSMIGETLKIADGQGNQMALQVSGIATKLTPKKSSEQKHRSNSVDDEPITEEDS